MDKKTPAVKDGTLMLKYGIGYTPYEFSGIEHEIDGYRKSAWIGIPLDNSPIYDVYGKDAVRFLNSICVNDFSKLGMQGLRHAVICNEEGKILTDGVVLRISEDRYRTYWLNPPIQYLLESSDMEVAGEDMTGTEYFVQIAGERSLEILEQAFCQDLHDIRFAKHRKIQVGNKMVEVVRLGMSGNLAYEIHGPIAELNEIYEMVWQSGKKYDARQLGMHAYSLFNHTEAGFPNINLHYPLPWMESGEGMAAWMLQHPMNSFMNLSRKLTGSVGDDLESRFMTPYDVGWGFLVNNNHEFTGKSALQKIAANPTRQVVTLEWNGSDVGAAFATRLTPGEEPVEASIYQDGDNDYTDCIFNQYFKYRADWILYDGKKIGISTGRCISFYYNSMISLGFIDPKYAKEGTELTLVFGTPGTRQMNIRVKVSRFPYNKNDFVRNEDRDVEDIPHYQK